MKPLDCQSCGACCVNSDENRGEGFRFYVFIDDAKSKLVYKGFEVVPGLIDLVHSTGLAAKDDPALSVAACELVLEALVARKRISRNDAGEYGRAAAEPRRRPSDPFGGNLA